MMRIWTKTALSASATPYLWSGATIEAPYGAEHLQQIIGSGLCCDDTLDLLTIDKGEGGLWAAYNLQLLKPAKVHEIILMMDEDQDGIYILVNDIARDPWTDLYQYS